MLTNPSPSVTTRVCVSLCSVSAAVDCSRSVTDAGSLLFTAATLLRRLADVFCAAVLFAVRNFTSLSAFLRCAVVSSKVTIISLSRVVSKRFAVCGAVVPVAAFVVLCAEPFARWVSPDLQAIKTPASRESASARITATFILTAERYVIVVVLYVAACGENVNGLVFFKLG